MTWLWLRRPMFALRWFTPPSTYRIKLYEFENTTFIFLLSRLQLESISVFSSMKTVFTSNQKKNVDIHCGYRLSNRRLHAVRQIKEEQNWTKNAEKKKQNFLEENSAWILVCSAPTVPLKSIEMIVNGDWRPDTNIYINIFYIALCQLCRREYFRFVCARMDHFVCILLS